MAGQPGELPSRNQGTAVHNEYVITRDAVWPKSFQTVALNAIWVSAVCFLIAWFTR